MGFDWYAVRRFLLDFGLVGSLLGCCHYDSIYLML